MKLQLLTRNCPNRKNYLPCSPFISVNFAGLLTIILTGCVIGCVTGCVSVQLPSAAIRKATDTLYLSPEKPFTEIKSVNADHAWLSAKTGNTISFLSECENPADPSLKQLESDSLSALGNVKIEHTQSSMYNGREAQTTEASGLVDGIHVKIKLVVVKKNGCSYTLTYGGVAKNFSAEAAGFEKFMQNFKIP